MAPRIDIQIPKNYVRGYIVLGGSTDDEDASVQTPNIQVCTYYSDRHREVRYRGETKDRLPNGWGKYFYRNGSIYSGHWRSGKRDGYGEMGAPPPPRVNVTDKFSQPPGEEAFYAGQWSRGLRHGFGVQFYSSRSFYEGKWLQGLRHGWGRMEYADGAHFEGVWRDGTRDGAGILRLANGDRFEGAWRGDKKEGAGRFRFVDSGKMIEGVWIGDVMVKGVME